MGKSCPWYYVGFVCFFHKREATSCTLFPFVICQGHVFAFVVKNRFFCSCFINVYMTKINKISVSVRIIRPAFVILWGIFIINLISENRLNENYYADARFVTLLSTQTSGPVCTICDCQQQKFVRIQWKKSGKIKHYANTPMQYTAIFHGCKNVNFQMKNYNIFLFCSKTLIVGTR